MHLRAIQPGPPEPAHRQETVPAVKSHFPLYETVPGTLELFQQHRVVHAGQTRMDLLSGNITSLTPEQWQKTTAEVRRPQGLVVLKAAGSGSTWFCKTLALHPAVHFVNEAQTFAHTASIFSAQTPHQRV